MSDKERIIDKSTRGRILFREDGEANRYAMFTEDGKWWLSLLLNGEQISERQEANLKRIAACWNACEGISTEQLENILMFDDTLAIRFKMRDQIERELSEQCNNAIALLRKFEQIITAAGNWPDTTAEINALTDLAGDVRTFLKGPTE